MINLNSIYFHRFEYTAKKLKAKDPVIFCDATARSYIFVYVKIKDWFILIADD